MRRKVWGLVMARIVIVPEGSECTCHVIDAALLAVVAHSTAGAFSVAEAKANERAARELDEDLLIGS